MRRPVKPAHVSDPGLGRRFGRRAYKIRHEVLSIARQYPRVFLPYASFAGPPQAHRIGARTAIVIEGFERSGNTFAVMAFSRSQSRPVDIAHHLHAAAQVIQAARRRIPALVLLRRPEEAIPSFLLFHGALSASQAMRTYIRFYAPLLPYKHSFVLARFDAVIRNFGSVIRCVNARFGTQFAEFEHSEANVRACFEQMEREERAKRGKPWIEETVTRPSSWREEMTGVVRSQFYDPALTKLRSRVDKLYAVCDSLADV
jgi:hypothetical protein